MQSSADRGNAAWYVISLRPAGQHAALRRAAMRAGAGFVAVSTSRIVACDDAATRRALRAALAAPVVVFTSPNAVRHAAALGPLRDRRGRIACAIGDGTAAALRRAGLRDVHVPPRADSEGLLALEPLQSIAGCDVGLVTAPGGRDRIAPGLQARGARVLRADVYMREPITPRARAWSSLREARGRGWIAASSGEALAAFAEQAPADLRVLALRVVAGSERIASLARTLGFQRVVVASGARPGDLVAAARDGGRRQAFR
jgi:uroporphyrinogen-III synthase